MLGLEVTGDVGSGGDAWEEAAASLVGKEAGWGKWGWLENLGLGLRILYMGLTHNFWKVQ